MALWKTFICQPTNQDFKHCAIPEQNSDGEVKCWGFVLHLFVIATSPSEMINQNSLLPTPAKACVVFLGWCRCGAGLDMPVPMGCVTLLGSTTAHTSHSGNGGSNISGSSQRKNIGNLKTLSFFFCQQSILFCWREEGGIKVKRVSERCNTLIFKKLFRPIIHTSLLDQYTGT